MANNEQRRGLDVGLFITCLVDLFRPQTGFAAVELIERSGCNVSVPLQSCCGQPAYNSGDRPKSTLLAKNIIKQFSKFDYVVAPSGSCASMISQHYPQLFENEPDWQREAQDLANKTFELSQFLVDVMKVDWKSSSTRLDGDQPFSHKMVTYHDSCSGLRELGIRSQPRKLLDQCANIVIEEMGNSEICCGFGGTFCFKYPEISSRLVDNKICGIESIEADVVVGGDLGCLMNIAGRLKRCEKQIQVFHFCELLLEQTPDEGIAE